MQVSPRPIRSIPFIFFSALCVIFLAGCPPHTWTPKPPYGTTTGTNDFDLTSKGSDPNGSPDVPQWAPQVQQSQNLPPTENSDCKKKGMQPYQAGCTDQSKFLVQDAGTGISGLFCSLFGDSSSINGHANWTVARAQGAIGWLNFADDGDYNLLLLPENEYGLTGNNNELPNNGGRYIEVEFDSREFDGRFGTKWWQDFASKAAAGAANGDYTEIEDYLHQGSGLAYGVVYGIFGIDCEHGCRSEIHPAYAVAIQLNESKGSNKWAVFARNWGDEGFCSHLDHQLDLSSTGGAIHLVLPYKSTGAPVVKTAEFASSNSQASQCPSFSFRANEGEEVSIPLPSPTDEGLTELIVEFTWPDGASPVEYRQVGKAALKEMFAKRKSAAAKPRPKESAEEHMGRLHRHFNQGKGLPEMGFREKVLQPYSAKLAAAGKSTALLKPLIQNNTPSPGCIVPETPSAAPQIAVKPVAKQGKLRRLRRHDKKEAWDRATMVQFCAAYEASGKKFPDGEPADLGPKLDKICSDKRLKP